MTDFTTFSLAALAVSYNVVAEALGQPAVKKFADKPTAVARLEKILGQAAEAGFQVEYFVNGAVQAVVKVESVHTPAAGMTPVEELHPAIKSVTFEPLVEEKVIEAPTETVVAPAARPTTTLDLSAKIKILVANPKRAGSRAHAVFALYADGQTGQEFVDAVVAAGHTVRIALANLHWDEDHGFIYLGRDA